MTVLKILIVQLSDIHCESEDKRLTKRFSKAVKAIKTIGKIDKAVLVFSGDLTNKAEKNEFKTGKQLLGRFIFDLGKELNCGYIHTKIVPGNHDILLPDGCRSAKEIEGWDKSEHIQEEIDKQKDFFEYSNSKHCFISDKLCDVETLVFGDVAIQFCLLNSAPFSTKDKLDKQFHYFPQYVSEKLARNADADLKVTVMHHHFEWCEWETKDLLKKAIASDDITFFGHDHKSESITTEISGGVTHNIIMGGEFSLKKNECSFNCIVYNSDSADIERFVFDWSQNDEIFIKKVQGKINCRKNDITPSEKYIEKILEDKQGISSHFTDYYVLPKLVAEGEAFSSKDSIDFIEIDDIFDAISTDKVIRITGVNGAGKTTLLKYLYYEAAQRGYYPLFVEKGLYKNSRMDKMLKDLFEDQYLPQTDNGYEKFLQAEDTKKIIFIDNLDLISNDTARANFIVNLLDRGYQVIYSTKEKGQDLEEMAKEHLKQKAISTIDITLFYKESRDKLVERVGAIYKKNEESISTIKSALDYMVQCQTSLFSFTPNNMLQYIKYFLRNTSVEQKGIQTISMVFEANIRSAIFDLEKPEIATLYLSAVEFIADQMYFELRTENINISKLEELIEKFNEKRKAGINAKVFKDTCIEARIFKDHKDSFYFSFYDKNAYAYFVAKNINKEFERNQANQTKLNYVMEHICFGINDIIVVFLAFIRNNTNIILNMAEQTTKLLHEYPEWNFDEKNIGFLHQSSKMAINAPNEKERKEAHEQIENVEKERHDIVKFRGIFDFDEDDVNTERYKILRALKYLQIIGRSFVDQYGDLEAEEIDRIVKSVFSDTQKLIFAILNPYQEKIDEIVKNIVEFSKQEFPNDEIDESEAREIVAQVGTILALNIMNDIAFNATNVSTIIALREGPIKTSNHNIFQLMMEENTGNTAEFVAKAVSLRKQLDNNPYAKMLVAQIARKHIIYTSNIDHRQIDKLLSGNVLSANNKAVLLLEQGTKSNR